MDEQHINLASTEVKEGTLDHVTAGNVLPRTVLRSNAFLLLDGEWKFAMDAGDEGLREGWHVHHDYKHTATWPGSVETHLAEAKGEKDAATWHDSIVVWYERSFDLPIRTAEQSHLMFQLTFGACGYDTRVWLNGHPLKTIEGEEVHYGEYTSFSYELDEEILLPDNNRITVRVADTMDAEIPRGKQESHVYKRGGIWYQTYTGAVRSVWIETVERNRLRSRVGVVSILEDQLVRFNLTTRIRDAGNYVIRLSVFELQEDDAPITTSDYALHLEPGQKDQRLVLEVPGAKPWSPESPYCYKLVAQLIYPDKYHAEIRAHFGLRKIEARGRYIYLNNKSIYLDGILYQPGTASFEEMKRHMRSIKELGCNLVRVHIAGVDPRIYNLADELGLLLWVEVPSPHSSSKLSRKNHREELLRMLSLIGTNPSIVIWSLYNEDWGAQDIASNPDTREYIVDTYHYMKIFHPQFLVVDNDGWRHVSLGGKLKSDLLTVHIYTPEGDRWKQLLGKLTQGDLEEVAAFPLIVGDPFFYRGQVPIVISEWGGFGFPDYGGPEDLATRAERIRLFKEELRKHRIAGDIYTQATNIEDERNGILEAKSGALEVPAGLLKSE